MAEQSASELRIALRRSVPALADDSIALDSTAGRVEPRWHSGSAVIGGGFVAKFAWSQEAAVRTRQEGQILLALQSAAQNDGRPVERSSPES